MVLPAADEDEAAAEGLLDDLEAQLGVRLTGASILDDVEADHQAEATNVAEQV